MRKNRLIAQSILCFSPLPKRLPLFVNPAPGARGSSHKLYCSMRKNRLIAQSILCFSPLPKRLPLFVKSSFGGLTTAVISHPIPEAKDRASSIVCLITLSLNEPLSTSYFFVGSKTSSMRPYSFALYADMKLSRSVSRSMISNG